MSLHNLELFLEEEDGLLPVRRCCLGPGRKNDSVLERRVVEEGVEVSGDRRQASGGLSLELELALELRVLDGAGVDVEIVHLHSVRDQAGLGHDFD